METQEASWAEGRNPVRSPREPHGISSRARPGPAPGAVPAWPARLTDTFTRIVKHLEV